MRFRDLRLSTKQTIGFGIILLFMTAANVYSIREMASIKAEIDEVTQSWLPKVIAISDIKLTSADLRRNQLQHAFAQNDSLKRQLEQAMKHAVNEINDHRDTYEQLVEAAASRHLSSAAEQGLYEDFDNNWIDYQDQSFEFFFLSRENRGTEAAALLNSSAREVYDDLSHSLDNLIEENKTDASLAAQRASNTFQSTRNITILLLIATVFTSIILILLLVRVMSVPLKRLVQAVRRVAEGDLEANAAIDSRDEFGELAQSFNQMTASLREAREKEQREAKLQAMAAELRIKASEAEARALQAENERKSRELEQARQLQMSMLPKTLPDIPGVDIGAVMIPATEVGGDYYDFWTEDDGMLTIAVGDATGHGLHAGTMVAAAKSLFNSLARKPSLVPTLQDASQALKEMGFHQMYMAITLAKFRDGMLRLSSAGMPYTLIYRAISGAIEEVVLKGMPLGSFPKFPYKEEDIQLNSNDVVLFMSDGGPEMFNDHGELLGEERTKELFKQCANKPAQEIVETMLASINAWSNGYQQEDDITFVALKVS